MKKSNKGQDALKRAHFLYQAAYATLLSTPEHYGLVSYYVHLMSMVAKKSQTKLGPAIKRQVCKKCHILLYPGRTSEVRLRSKKGKRRIIKCKICGTVKAFLTKPDYQLGNKNRLRKNAPQKNAKKKK